MNVPKKACQVCQAAEAKYKCPKCHMATCSLPCSNSHKTSQNCNGERDKTTFVPLAEFNEQHLLSDFGFLEEINRVASNSSRGNEERPGGYKLPQKFKFMVKNAAERAVTLSFMEKGLKKHDQNRTKFNNKLRMFLWTVEWIFHQTDARILDHNVGEDSLLSDLLGKKIASASASSTGIQSFAAANPTRINLLYKKPFTPANKPEYVKLNLAHTLKANLAGLSIIEYPIFHVVLEEDLSQFNVTQFALEIVEIEQGKGHESDHEAGPPPKRFKQESPEGSEDEGEEAGEEAEDDESDSEDETSSNASSDDDEEIGDNDTPDDKGEAQPDIETSSTTKASAPEDS